MAAARQAAAAAAAGSGRCQVALALSAAASQAVEFSSGCCRLRCVCMNWPPNAAGLSGPTIGQWTPVTNWSVWVYVHVCVCVWRGEGGTALVAF